jgi:hypothetical protein
LTRLAGQAASDPAYFGWLLDRYRASEGLSTSALAALLRIGEDSLPNLSLCLRPRAERFAADVLAVATHVGADATVLAALVRHVDAVDAMATGGRGAAESGFLLAARAREMRREAEPNPAAEYRNTHEPPVPPAEDRSAGGRGARDRRDEEGP